MRHSLGVPNESSLKAWNPDIAISDFSYELIYEKRFCHLSERCVRRALLDREDAAHVNIEIPMTNG